MALDRAKDAAKKERLVCRQREQQGLVDQMNADLTSARLSEACGLFGVECSGCF